MKNKFTTAIATAFLLAGCATSDNNDKAAMSTDAAMGNAVIAQAEADVKTALDAGAQWLILDKSAGSKAVSFNKLIEIAKEKEAAGETEEAERIAMHVSEASKMALGQHERYANARPRYNN